MRSVKCHCPRHRFTGRRAPVGCYPTKGAPTASGGGEGSPGPTLVSFADSIRGVVHSFEAGTTFTLAEPMLDMLDAISPAKDKRFLLTRVTHVGMNNLPTDLSA